MNFLDLIYPNDIYCIVCGRPLPAGIELPLCDRCSSEIHWVSGRLCEKCGKPLAESNPKSLCHDCSNDEHLFDRGYTCALYHGHAANIIRDMKYRDKPAYGDAVAALMMACIMAVADAGAGVLPDWDIIIPVPMYRAKREDRGYNQAELIARGLSKRLTIPLCTNVLIKNRDTGVMSRLSRGDRTQNLAGALAVNQNLADKISNKTILLVDDVYTTGSTADACAEALKSAGGNTVDLITFATGADGIQNLAQDIVFSPELLYNSADIHQIGL